MVPAVGSWLATLPVSWADAAAPPSFTLPKDPGGSHSNVAGQEIGEDLLFHDGSMSASRSR